MSSGRVGFSSIKGDFVTVRVVNVPTLPQGNADPCGPTHHLVIGMGTEEERGSKIGGKIVVGEMRFVTPFGSPQSTWAGR